MTVYFSIGVWTSLAMILLEQARLALPVTGVMATVAWLVLLTD